MEQPPKPVEQTPSPNAPDAQKLLESANNASQQVAVLHAAFIAACTYVMVIAFGRTDLDLLIGKGIRLPIVDTEVPIVGFFAAAPWILVVVHFNLLLHLQLLARKLHDFDQADQQGKLRSQLRIFPITWYLAGRTEQYTRTLLSLMASITIILLPLLALFILQLQFLAYQSEAITWGQRIAIWVDLGQLIVFWPLIIQSGGVWITLDKRWKNFREQYLPRKRDWIAPVLSGIGLFAVFWGSSWCVVTGLITMSLTTITSVISTPSQINRIGIIVALLTGALALYGTAVTISDIPNSLEWLKNISFITAIIALSSMTGALWLSVGGHKKPRSGIIMLIVATLGFPLSLGLQVDGEFLEQLLIACQPSEKYSSTMVSRIFIPGKRILNLQEQLLFANHPDPEIVAQLRSSEWTKALQKIEPINLQGRSLRHANFENAILCGADLRNTELQGANFRQAWLLSADVLVQRELENSAV